MPATARPSSDYERWLQNYNPDVEFQPSPQYGPHHGSRFKKFPPFQTPKTDRPRNPFAEPQSRFSPTDKELGSSSTESSDTPTFILLFLFMILVAVAYAQTQFAHSARARQPARKQEQ